MAATPDTIQRRIVVEYGHWYAYVYITDADGKVLEDDSFKQPFRLDRKDVSEEAKDCYDNIWDWLNETVNITPLQDGDGGKAD